MVIFTDMVLKGSAQAYHKQINQQLSDKDSTFTFIQAVQMDWTLP